MNLTVVECGPAGRLRFRDSTREISARGVLSQPIGRAFSLGLLLTALTLPLSADEARIPDLVIRNGTVVDGGGRPARQADVAIDQGRIVLVGTNGSAGKREIDARGLVVAPGFIDVHTHAENIIDLPLAENFVRMGVTTVVVGNCGSSEPDVGDFFERVRAARPVVNVGSLIGHGTIRNQIMGGSFMRPPTGPEQEAMREKVRQSMQEGALGISTGLIYLPGSFARTEEIIDLARVAAAFGGIYTSHMRSEGEGITEALAEFLQIAREARIRSQISHIKLSGPEVWGKPDTILDTLNAARAGGLEISQDAYVYVASSTGIGTLIPNWAREGGTNAFNTRLNTPSERARLVEEMKESLRKSGRADYRHAVIAHCEADPSLDGMNLVQASMSRRGSDQLSDQIELILAIQRNGGAQGVFFNMLEEDIRRFLTDPHTMVASDSGVRDYQNGVPHPRGYGNNARVLARYVRELRLIPLEQAIRKMSALPAELFRIPERGLLKAGYHADLVIFDPETVQDHARFESPHHYATGFRWVLVNGDIAVENDRLSGARPGQVIKRAGTP